MMKVAELEGAALDAWVAKALGWKHLGAVGIPAPGRGEPDPRGMWCKSGQNDWWQDRDGNSMCGPCYCFPYAYSMDWEKGGPIIERERICLTPNRERKWYANAPHSALPYMMGGDTPLIAAMRCFVASKFGETVPDEATASQG